MPIDGAPEDLFKVKEEPKLKLTAWFWIRLVVLGFGASSKTGEIVSTSYPLIYALPGLISIKFG